MPTQTILPEVKPHFNLMQPPPQVNTDEPICRHCSSRDMHKDWAQGDLVCRSCGVVEEEKLRDSRPEWREFNDADDLAKGLPAAARCGLVPIDESQYLGGLQPTRLSSAPFGGGDSASLAMMRKRLKATNRKLDYLMENFHRRSLDEARVALKVRKRQLETDSDMESAVGVADDVQPDHESLLLQEEEDAHQAQAVLNSEKWSLRRAILLHGDGQDYGIFDNATTLDSLTAEREELNKRLDSKLRKAAEDLYNAYTILQDGARKLHLPDRVTAEATTLLCRFAARRDGFIVRGVASRLSVKKQNAAFITAARRKEAMESLREHNKLKQMGALCAALLFLTARNLGWTRSLVDACGAISPPSNSQASNMFAGNFIVAKHCSRAIDEVKSIFPDFARSLLVAKGGPVADTYVAEGSATANFVDHSVRKLLLPPVAQASIRTLVIHLREMQLQTGEASGVKLNTICACAAYFICMAGSLMQLLAHQAQAKELKASSRKSKLGSVLKNYRTKLQAKNVPKEEKIRHDEKRLKTESVHEEQKLAPKDYATEPFDVFSHDVGEDVRADEKEYEMRRVWDTWAEQTPWSRSLGDVEQSCGVSENMILEFYDVHIFPHRVALLEFLKKAAVDTIECNNVAGIDRLNDTPLAPILLSHIGTAAALMSSTSKKK